MKTFQDKRGGYLELLRVAYPLIFMSASNVVMQFADRKFLSASSTQEMAAALPSGVLFFTFFVFFSVTCGYTSTLVAQWYGKGDRKECVRSVWAGLWLAGAAAILCLTVLPWLCNICLKWSMTETLYPLGKEYLKGFFPAGAVACLSMPFFAFFSGRGKTAVVAGINIFVCIANIFLNWLLIFGNWGFPRWGIFGAGLATSISGFLGLVTAALLYWYFDQRRFPTRQYRKPDLQRLGKLIKFGSPAGLQILSDVGCFSGILLIVGRLGDDALAACSIGFAVNNLSFMPLMGIADATAILSGQYIGKNELDIAGRVPRKALRIILTYMFFTGLFYLISPEWIARFFSPENTDAGLDFEGIIQQVRWVLFGAALWNFADCYKLVYGGLLRGAGDTRAIMAINVFCSWVLVIPGILFLVFCLRPPVAVIWFYLVFTTVAEAAMVYRRYHCGKWRKIGLVKN
ncbi:MAG: MATE family efflux transporter [Lentisphaeria bacterium]|nr:MATE family efflux transporter [Lentisphaeria bacterium]